VSQVTLEEAKDQVSIEHENDLHDARLLRLIGAAESWAANFLNRDLDFVSDSPVDSPGADYPEAVKSAILLHVEAEFDRDPQTMELLIARARDLLWPYRVGLGIY
jgi:hypothetical protein